MDKTPADVTSIKTISFGEDGNPSLIGTLNAEKKIAVLYVLQSCPKAPVELGVSIDTKTSFHSSAISKMKKSNNFRCKHRVQLKG